MAKEFGISFAVLCFCLAVTFIETNGQGFTTAPVDIKVSRLGTENVIADEITVTWKPPLQVKGSIHRYTVMYTLTDKSDSNHTLSTGPQATSVEIHNLLFYTNYTIYVRAQTDLGNGEWSPPVIYRTHEGTANDVCIVTKVYSSSPSTIFISWKELPLENHRGILTSYIVFWVPVGVTDYTAKYKSRILPLSVRNFTITELMPFTSYYILVLARNGANFYITPAMLKKVTVAKTMEDVPSRPPSNLRSQFICSSYELSISWLPLSKNYTNGKLRSYKVLLYQGQALYKNASVTSEKTTSLVSLDECRNYTVVLAAVTTPGAGSNITTNAITSCPCGPPQPLRSKRILVAGENQSFTLPCGYKGRPAPTVYWIRNGQRLHGNKRTFNNSKVNGHSGFHTSRISKQLTNGSWYVSHAVIEDSGSYACVLNSSFGLATSNVTLYVDKDVVTIKFGLTLLNKAFHKDLRNSASEMFLKLSFRITDQIIKLFIYSDKKFSVKVIEVLQFRNGSGIIADMEAFATVDDPTYKDTAYNMIKSTLLQVLSGSKRSLGNLSVSTLVIQAPPPSPVNLKVTETKQTRLQFSWSPPKFHDAYSITGYSLQYRKKGEGNMTSTKMFPAGQHYGVINGLVPDTSYEVVVVAHNKHGIGISEVVIAKTVDWTTIIVLSTVIPIAVLFFALILFMLWRNKAQRNRREKLQQALALTSNVWYQTYLERNTSKQWWEIPRASLEVGDQLGSGAFGEVKKGVLKNKDETVVCAIKMLKQQATEADHIDLVNELNIMASVGEHRNIISLIGACTTDGPLWLVVKFAENGNLLSYLQSHRQETSEGYENIINTTTNLDPAEKLFLACGIAKGMRHLEKKRCVHRDLAARNVLLGERNRPMVSDFGLSRDIYESGQYEKKTGGKLPVKWMAIESLEDYVYTKQSDVWSYGVVLWEIESGGRVPYPGLNGMELLSKLKCGYRLQRPGGCSLEIYHIMCSCWATDPTERPSFETLEKRMEDLLLDIEGNEEILDEYHLYIQQPEACVNRAVCTRNAIDSG